VISKHWGQKPETIFHVMTTGLADIVPKLNDLRTVPSQTWITSHKLDWRQSSLNENSDTFRSYDFFRKDSSI